MKWHPQVRPSGQAVRGSVVNIMQTNLYSQKVRPGIYYYLPWLNVNQWEYQPKEHVLVYQTRFRVWWISMFTEGQGGPQSTTNCWTNMRSYYILGAYLECALHMSIILFITHTADSRLAPSQWETSLQSNAVSHWLVASPESALTLCVWLATSAFSSHQFPKIPFFCNLFADSHFRAVHFLQNCRSRNFIFFLNPERIHNSRDIRVTNTKTTIISIHRELWAVGFHHSAVNCDTVIR